MVYLNSLISQGQELGSIGKLRSELTQLDFCCPALDRTRSSSSSQAQLSGGLTERTILTPSATCSPSAVVLQPDCLRPRRESGLQGVEQG